ncbi:hypothetical protein HHI36_002641 [Cryptolaemus montrouzieri]|uniref:Lipase domain-containing protein n=1 Tax=Cryptolaemus montrouzieri TaxID=559131 RepID=A0ABD2PBN1_9CUCU
MAVVFITRSNLVIWFSGFIFFVKCIFGQMDITTVKIETTTEENLSYVPPVYPNEIEFHLFTSKYYTDQYVLINPNKTETYNHLFGKMYFLMHGWKEFPENTSWFYPITEILLKKFPHASVIHMDWRKQSNLFYNVSLYTIPKVSEFMGDFIAKIYVSNNKPKEIVLMGNSLGGQLISYVAKRFKNVTGKKSPESFLWILLGLFSTLLLQIKDLLKTMQKMLLLCTLIKYLV